MAGNANSGRRKSERDFAAMVRIAVYEKGTTGEPKIRELADVLVAQALQGEGWALREIADRLDGKASQAIEHGGHIDVATKEQRDAVVASALRLAMDERENA